MVFFFNGTATTEIYTLSLHDALPICAARAVDHGSQRRLLACAQRGRPRARDRRARETRRRLDRKSTRLNSSHGYISYAVFCLKKKKIKVINTAFVGIAIDPYWRYGMI